jgi:hypothetical protein
LTVLSLNSFLELSNLTMASLLFAASYLTYNKLKTKSEERKEKKRKAYADRYSELQREHTREMEKQGQYHRAGSSKGQAELPTSPVQPAETQDRRSSSESVRSDDEKAGGPSAWVDEVIRERSQGGQHNRRQSGHEEAKIQSVV